MAREALEQELHAANQRAQAQQEQEEVAARAFNTALAAAAEACGVGQGELAAEAAAEARLDAWLVAARAQRPEVEWKEDRRAGDMARRFRREFNRDGREEVKAAARTYTRSLPVSGSSRRLGPVVAAARKQGALAVHVLCAEFNAHLKARVLSLQVGY